MPTDDPAKRSDAPTPSPGTLLCIGLGYCARALAAEMIPAGWTVIGTTRERDQVGAIRALGAEPALWPEEADTALARATHLLVSAAPQADGDPVLSHLGPALRARAPALAWIGYLSTTGVYGDRQGGWVDETSPCRPGTERGRRRLEAERAWLRLVEEMGPQTGLSLHIFRLAGIYGPRRGPFAKLRAGTAQRIVKPGQIFSRIHVADIVAALRASIAAPDPVPAIYNLCDDCPAPPEDVIAHAARLLGLPVPPEVAFDEADLSPMARSFYAEAKRVSNAKVKARFGLEWRYPDYRSGLAACLAAEGGDASA